MVAVVASEDEVLPLLAGLESEVSIAAVNGPSSVVLSGLRTRSCAWLGGLRRLGG